MKRKNQPHRAKFRRVGALERLRARIGSIIEAGAKQRAEEEIAVLEERTGERWKKPRSVPKAVITKDDIPEIEVVVVGDQNAAPA